MQITARKPRFPNLNLKYVAAALGIVAVLAAGTVAYTVTRDDSSASRPIAAAPTLKSYHVEQAGEGAIVGNTEVTSGLQSTFVERAGEGTIGGNQDVPSSDTSVFPTLREGFPASGKDNDITGISPESGGVMSVTSRDEAMSYSAFGSHEGFISGNESADLSYLAPKVRSYAEALFLEQNGVYEVTTDNGTAVGMLYEEGYSNNPGADR